MIEKQEPENRGFLVSRAQEEFFSRFEKCLYGEQHKQSIGAQDLRIPKIKR